MKISTEQQITEERMQMRSGVGTTQLHHIVQGSQLPPNCRFFSRITLHKGCSIGEHIHKGEAEIFYILSGNAQMSDNGKIISLQAGDTCINYSGESHSILCTGDSPLEILASIITG